MTKKEIEIWNIQLLEDGGLFVELKKAFFNLRNQKDDKSYVETSNSDVMSNAFT